MAGKSDYDTLREMSMPDDELVDHIINIMRTYNIYLADKIDRHPKRAEITTTLALNYLMLSTLPGQEGNAPMALKNATYMLAAIHDLEL